MYFEKLKIQEYIEHVSSIRKLNNVKTIETYSVKLWEWKIQVLRVKNDKQVNKDLQELFKYRNY